jgi:hypothetical protein
MDVVDKIIELTELFDDNVVTTADKIDRPQQALDKEAFDDFNKRNPMAGGGMLVQPGFGGVRQGYKQDIKPPTKKQLEITEKVYSKKYGKTGIDLWESLKQFERSNIRQGQVTGGTGGIGKLKKNQIGKDDFIKLVNANKDKTYNQFVEILKDYKTKDNKSFTKNIIADRLRQYNLSGSFKKEPPKGSDPTKKAETEKKRQASLKETDPTKAKGKGKFQYHHVRQIEGGVPLTSDDVLIINQRINSKIGGETNKTLNRISAAIRKNNKLALEAMNAKQEGLALQYMERSDKLNAQAEKIVNSAIDDLPKKYKGYVGFNQFTLPRDEYGLPIGNEPMIIKKVGGMPVSKDAIDLTNLNLRDEQKFKSIVRQQAEKGKIGKIDIKEIIKTRVKQGQVKGLIPFMKQLGIKCQLSTGINCMNPKAYEKSLNELIVKSNAGDAAAKAKMLKFGNKVSTAGRLIKGALGPIAIASEIALDVGLSLYDTMDKGVPVKQAFADSLTNKYILGPELQVDKQEEIKKELLEREMPDGTKIMLEDTPFNRQRGLEFAMAKRGERKGKTIFGVPLMAQSKEADKQRLKERQKQMDALYADELASKDLSNEEIDAFLAGEGVYSPYTLGLGMQQKKPGEGEMRYNEDVAYDELRDLFNKSVQDAIISKQFKNIADAGGVANLAGGGIAKLAGVDSGPPPEAGPNSRGLSSLMKRGTNT